MEDTLSWDHYGDFDSFTASHWVTHSPTLGKYNAHHVISTWKMSIFIDLADSYVLQSISSWM